MKQGEQKNQIGRITRRIGFSAWSRRAEEGGGSEEMEIDISNVLTESGLH